MGREFPGAKVMQAGMEAELGGYVELKVHVSEGQTTAHVSTHSRPASGYVHRVELLVFYSQNPRAPVDTGPRE